MSVAVADEDAGLTIGDAADDLGVHSRTLRRYINDGRIEAIRYSSQVVRIERAELKRFRQDNIRVVTGTGTCYVPRPPKKRGRPTKAATARARVGRFG